MPNGPPHKNYPPYNIHDAERKADHILALVWETGQHGVLLQPEGGRAQNQIPRGPSHENVVDIDSPVDHGRPSRSPTAPRLLPSDGTGSTRRVLFHELPDCPGQVPGPFPHHRELQRTVLRQPPNVRSDGVAAAAGRDDDQRRGSVLCVLCVVGGVSGPGGDSGHKRGGDGRVRGVRAIATVPHDEDVPQVVVGVQFLVGRRGGGQDDLVPGHVAAGVGVVA